MDVVPGNPERNLKTGLERIARARDAGNELIVLPEMFLSGYLLGDEWENAAFMREVADMNGEIRAATDGIAAVWGNVAIDPTKRGEDGRLRKYNAAFVAQNGLSVSNGVFDGCTIKALMPKYREFDDERHFYSLLKLAYERGVPPESLLEPFELVIGGIKRRVGIIICEDMWDEDYAFKPVSILKSKGADMIVNVSASPFGLGKSAKRDRLLAEHSKGTTFFYANNVGVQNNGKNVFLFDGGSSVWKNGEKIGMAEPFSDSDVSAASGVPENWGSSEAWGNMREIETALVTAIRTSMERAGKKKLVIGLSGGIDSAVVATLAVRALGPENVIAVNMPSEFNSDTTKGLAAELAANLGIRYESVPIQASVEATKAQLESVFDRPLDKDPEKSRMNFENLQARDRGGRVLAGVASMFDAVFTNNGNKTEFALGYATLYGDVNGFLAVIGDLYKTQVFALARHLNQALGNVIPEGILTLPPSAELSSAQNVDEGKGDPFDYPVVDSILMEFIEFRRDPEELLEDWIDGKIDAVFAKTGRTAAEIFETPAAFVAEIERLWKLFKNSYFKRVQAPPIVTVSKRSLGFDLRESQNGAHFTRRYLALKERMLGLET